MHEGAVETYASCSEDHLAVTPVSGEQHRCPQEPASADWSERNHLNGGPLSTPTDGFLVLDDVLQQHAHEQASLPEAGFAPDLGAKHTQRCRTQPTNPFIYSGLEAFRRRQITHKGRLALLGRRAVCLGPPLQPRLPVQFSWIPVSTSAGVSFVSTPHKAGCRSRTLPALRSLQPSRPRTACFRGRSKRYGCLGHCPCLYTN